MKLSRREWMLGAAAASAAKAGLAKPLGRKSSGDIDKFLQELQRSNGIPALSLAITQRGEVVYARAVGQADIELAVAASPAHRFRLGSVSKIFTATLTAILAARGAIDLDAPISNYLPELPARHRATTLKQLLTHRGGLRHYSDRDFDLAAPGGSIDLRNYPDNRSVLAIFIDDDLVAPPGTRVSYSTYGYTLAQVVLESAIGVPFLELLQRELAEPLGLTTLAGDAPRSLVPNRVSGYSRAENVPQVRPQVTTPVANAPWMNCAYKWSGGGLLAAPSDVARFGAAHLGDGGVPVAARELLFTVLTEATKESRPLGLGWRIDRDDAQRLRYHHAGGLDGARAVLVAYPEQEIAIAFAANLGGRPDDVLSPAARIVAMLAG
jgi:serine beta-lactamase-like protein LACTB, mitochondrial